MTRSTVGGHRLTGVLGAGGFAVTYATRGADGEPAAVKVLAANWAQDLDVSNRFEVECEMLAGAPELIGADRYAVPRYVAHGVEDGQPYLVTEMCAGGSLAQRLPLMAQGGDADRLGWAMWVLAEAARCLHVVHDRLGVVHRDLSPGNLLFRRRPDASGPDASWPGGSGPGGGRPGGTAPAASPAALPGESGEELVVGDFGLMKEAALASNFSHVAGTATYAVPEVRDLGVCDRRSDLYSLGVIAAEILSGVRAVENPELITSWSGARSTSSPRVSARSEPLPVTAAPEAIEAPPEVIELVAAMLAPERGGRPDLEEVLAVAAPLAAAAPPVPATIVSPLPAVRRRRRAFQAVAMAAVLGVAGGTAWALTRGEDLQVYTPAQRGFSVSLDPAWTEVDEEPGNGAAFTAQNQSRGLGLFVTSAIAPNAAAAAERAAASLAGAVEGLRSDTTPDGKARLSYVKDGRQTVTFFMTQRCGALAMTVIGKDPMPASLVDGIGERFAAVPVAAIPERREGDPAGVHRVARNGVSLAAPEGFVTTDSPDSCLMLVDGRSAGGASGAVTVTLVAGSRPAETMALYESRWKAGKATVRSGRSATGQTGGAGAPRWVLDGAQQRSSAFRFVEGGAGTYVVEAMQFNARPWTPTQYAFWDGIAATLEIEA